MDLRPGDTIIFNPLYPHCISTKTDVYQDIDVVSASLYTKMQYINNHDNDLPLKEGELEVESRMI